MKSSDSGKCMTTKGLELFRKTIANQESGQFEDLDVSSADLPQKRQKINDDIITLRQKSGNNSYSSDKTSDI